MSQPFEAFHRSSLASGARHHGVAAIAGVQVREEAGRQLVGAGGAARAARTTECADEDDLLSVGHRVLLDSVQGRGDQLIEDLRIGRGAVGGGFGRDRARSQRAGEEPLGDRQVAALGQQYLSDLAVLVDCTVQMRPPAAHLDVCLVGEPPITRHVAARPRRLGELAREPLHPPVHGDVIDGNAALGE
jgi:hypothetical protein